MTTVLAVVVSVLPVFLFLAALVLIDSYKLVTLRAILLSVCAGVLAGLAAYAVIVYLRPALGLDVSRYSLHVAPVVEESLKAAYVVYLLHRSRVGFVVDAAIHGFGIGTGFAFVENLYYVMVNTDATLWTWFVRGFGTAMMHGGATAIVAMATKALHNRFNATRLDLVLPGLVVAVIMHALYNRTLVHPLLATGLIVLIFPLLSVAVFQQSERETQSWLGTGFDMDQELLRAMSAGQVSETPVGKYLKSLRGRFSPEVIVDMMCLLRLRAEMGIRAKGILMMREAGFDPPAAPDLKGTFDELRYLERNIGRTGMLALGPFLRTSTRDLWQMSVLGS